MDFVIPADHERKMIKSEKIDRYLDLARELEKLYNMKVTVIVVVSLEQYPVV